MIGCRCRGVNPIVDIPAHPASPTHRPHGDVLSLHTHGDVRFAQALVTSNSSHDCELNDGSQHLSVSLYLSASVSQPLSLSLCLSAFVSQHLSVRLYLSAFICQHLSLSLCLSAFVSQSLFLKRRIIWIRAIFSCMYSSLSCEPNTGMR